MADFIPTHLNQVKATVGEKKVFKFLEHLLADEVAQVWFEPQALGRYSDFLIWHPQWGFLAIEVKDWSKNTFKSLDAKYFRGTFYKGSEEVSVENPHLQARQFSLRLINQLKQNASFIQTQGAYQGKLIFPITYAVFYSHLMRHDAEQMGLLHEAITPNHKVLFKDELDEDLSDLATRNLLKARLKNCFQDVGFRFEALSAAQEKALRYMIFPEIRVNHLSQSALFEAQPQDIQALDLQQESVAKNIAEGHRILKGVAGSGKSLVLASRAQYLRKIYPDWHILVVCFNTTLCNHIKAMLGESAADIQVLHFHGVVKQITGANLSKLAAETAEQYDARITALFKDYLANHMLDKKYDAILIDEGQDFSQAWIQLLTSLVNPETNSILFCYDPAQNIFNRSTPSWKSIGLQVQGKRPIELMKCYRNTKEILDVARQFLNPKKMSSLTSQDIYDRVLDPDMGECLHGHAPVLHHEADVTQLFALVARKIHQLLTQGVAQSDIAILRAYEKGKSSQDQIYLEQAFAQYCPEAQLKKVFESQDKKKLDLSEQSIKLLNIESAKGLEFKYVFFLGCEHMPRTSRELDTERKLAYVALTRAKAFLYVLARQQQGFFQELQQIMQQPVPVATVSQVDLTQAQEICVNSPEQRAYQPWSEDEDVQLIDALFKENLGVKQIAQRLQRRSSAVDARIKKLRLLE